MASRSAAAASSRACTTRRASRSSSSEFQSAAHDIGGTAGRRDTIKRIALERAGVRYIEIAAGTSPAEMQRIIRQLLA